ncbi:hypothetical protein J3U06_07755 [Bifidobacterium sp. B4142]|nr:hypothetical protein [Bifidobacterium sp. B4142]
MACVADSRSMSFPMANLISWIQILLFCIADFTSFVGRIRAFLIASYVHGTEEFSDAAPFDRFPGNSNVIFVTFYSGLLAQ